MNMIKPSSPVDELDIRTQEEKDIDKKSRRELLLKQVQVINGVECYSVAVFAELTGRSDQTIRKMVLYGNRLGNLKTVHIARSVFIPISELTEFKFCLPGTDSRYFVFDENGIEHMRYSQ